MEQFLPNGVTIEDIITLMAGLAGFLMMMAVWSTGIVKQPMHGRLKNLQDRRDALKKGYIAPTKRRSPVKSAKGVGLMRIIVSKMNLLKDEQARKYEKQLEQAGFRTKDALVIFLFFKLALPMLIGLVALIVLFGFDITDWPQIVKSGAAIGAILVASMAPEIYVKNCTSKRNDVLRKALPDALDLLVICTEAGLTLDAALQRVVRENGDTNPEMADELGLTAVELGFLPDRKQALINLAEPVTLPAIRAVTATLIQSEKYGTPLSQSLRVLSNEFRNERVMKAEEKAARLPAIMTVPLIMFIMPTLFVVLMGPAACSISDNLVGMGK